jgi:hypothetical protein
VLYSPLRLCRSALCRRSAGSSALRARSCAALPADCPHCSAPRVTNTHAAAPPPPPCPALALPRLPSPRPPPPRHRPLRPAPSPSAGRAYLALNDCDDALRHFTRALVIDPGCSSAHLDIAQLLFNQGGGAAHTLGKVGASKRRRECLLLAAPRPPSAFPPVVASQGPSMRSERTATMHHCIMPNRIMAGLTSCKHASATSLLVRRSLLMTL